jgi:hypothetical protein
MVHHGSDHIELPAVPSQFDCCPERALVAVAGPGPDFVTLISYPMGQAEVRTLSAPRLTLDVNPNPCRELTTIQFSPLASRFSRLALNIYNATGQLVFTQPVRTSSFILRTSSLLPGVYLCRLTATGSSATTRLVVTH